jgi:hypothetical protein
MAHANTFLDHEDIFLDTKIIFIAALEGKI